jgi:hypothetical protein
LENEFSDGLVVAFLGFKFSDKIKWKVFLFLERKALDELVVQASGEKYEGKNQA